MSNQYNIIEKHLDKRQKRRYFGLNLPPDPQKEVRKKNAVWSRLNILNELNGGFQENNRSVINAKSDFIRFKHTFRSIMLLEKISISSEISSTNRNLYTPLTEAELP